MECQVFGMYDAVFDQICVDTKMSDKGEGVDWCSAMVPKTQVVSWIEQRSASSLYLSVLTVGEIRHGVENVTDLPRRHALQDWLENDLPAFFFGRILSIDERVADRWGWLLAEAGRPLPAIDSLLAATAVAHGLTLVRTT